MPAQIDSEYRRISSVKAFHRYIALLFFEGRPITSRARWLNFFTFSVYAFLKYLPQLKKVEKPVFIVGMGRSGTTFLAKTLSLHPDFAFLNEPKALWYKVHPVDDVIGNYGKKAGRYLLTKADFTSQKALDVRKFYGAFLGITGAKKILDKYPEMIFRTDFILSLFPKARFIFIIRNGFDTCYSIAEWNKRNAQGINNWWGKDDRKWKLIKEELLISDSELAPFINQEANDEQRAALEWLVTTSKGLQLREKQPDSVLMIKHEDLFHSGSDSIKAILSFCKLEPAPILEEYLDKALVRPDHVEKSALDIDPRIIRLIEKRNLELAL